MKTKYLIVLTLVLCSFSVRLIAQPLTVWPLNDPLHPNVTAENLVTQVLITGCLQAYNVTYTGDPQSIGYFFRNPNPPPNFPFPAGVVMTSGLATNAVGPNNSGSKSHNSSGPSDPHLNALIPQSTNDACVLEFDFIPADAQMAFQYIFGSEEYLEYVNSSFNDVFAFFLSGPSCANPTNPNANYNNVNIALIPGTPTPVSINNVNNVAFSNYYYDNGNGSSANNEACQYDGYTVPLWAHKCVIPCATYHIKLAVADAGDSSLDSGVFLRAGSFLSGEVVSMSNYNPVGANNEIVEGCENFYVFTRTDTTDLSDTLEILLDITGTANVGGDISGFPTTTWILPGFVSDTIYYSALLDNVAEGTEYLVFTLLNGCPCTIGSTADTIWVIDNVTLEGGILNNDTLICSPTSPMVTLTATANTDPTMTHYLWNTGETTSMITVVPVAGQDTILKIQITDDCGQLLEDSVKITVSDMSSLTIIPTDLVCYDVCTGSVLVTPDNGFAPYSYAWNPGGLGSSTSGTATNLCAGSYTVTASDMYGCTVSESFTINQPPAVTLSFSSVPASCPGAIDGSLTVNVSNGFPSYNFTCSTIPTVTGVPTNSYTFQNVAAGNYTINVVDGRGCLASDIFPVDELTLNYTTIVNDISCYGYTDGNATAQISGGTPPYQYLWSNGQSTANLNNVLTGNYTCTVTDDHGCNIYVPVTIDEPSILTMANSLDTTMCKGETAQLEVQAYGGTPPYSYLWSEGSLSGDTVLVSPSSSTHYYVTVLDANNCSATSQGVLVELYPAVSPKAYANIDSICKGDSTRLYMDVVGGNGGPYFFKDDSGEQVEFPLTVAPELTTTYSLSAFDYCGSDSGLTQVTIHVMDPEPGTFSIEDSIGCVPFTVHFEETSPDLGQTFFWTFADLPEDNYSIEKSPSYTFENAGTWDVSLTVTSNFGCPTTVYKEHMVTVLPKPEADFLLDPEVAKITRPYILFENMTSSLGVLDRLYYNFGDGHSTIVEVDLNAAIGHTYQDTGSYDVTMIAETTDGCKDTIIHRVQINGDHAFYAPNAFNPTSSNPYNREFKPHSYGVELMNYHMIIYDRWGTKVFETFNYYKGWDGRINGGEIGKLGSYPWIVTYKDSTGKTVTEKGAVNLIQ